LIVKGLLPTMKKFIFIDDSPSDHFILKRILSKYQLEYDVMCTVNGADVINFLEMSNHDVASLPDIILVNLYMPDFDGWGFLDSVQSLYPYVPKPSRIYILSSSINPRDMGQAKQYSCVRSFIFKPITREILEKYIGEESSAM